MARNSIASSDSNSALTTPRQALLRGRARGPYPSDPATDRRCDPDRSPIQIGEIILDPVARTASKAGEPLELTAKEFDLLRLLMSRAGEVVGREDMDEVWDPHWFGPTKTLDVHISWLRKKIQNDPKATPYITTLRGVGFRFLAPDADVGSGRPLMGRP